MTVSVPICMQVFCVGCGKTGLKPRPSLEGWLAVAPDGSAICGDCPHVLEAFLAAIDSPAQRAAVDNRIQIGPTDI